MMMGSLDWATSLSTLNAWALNLLMAMVFIGSPPTFLENSQIK
jgi:hypothetical protein